MNGEVLEQIAAKRAAAREGQRCRVSVCSGLGCESVGGKAVLERIRGRMKAEGLGEASEVYPTCCRGLCQRGPIVEVEWADAGERRRHLYLDVNEETADRIAVAHAREGKPPADLPSHAGDPFFTRQTKIVLANAGAIDPEDIESCIAAGAYSALEKALTELKPSDVIQEITRSGLRGRGGGGYPTGLKWSTVAKEQGARKYVVCNGDEGDPGAFMDRSVLEGDPHEVLEGMAVAAYAVGAEQGYVYVRAEYPLAIERLRAAIKQAERLNLLGTHILDTAFNFRVDVRTGAGAFVCGEETALIASIEGNRGTPRPRPPYPATSGLWGQPTLINNVETLANVPAIIRNGSAWFAGIGSERSKGTKVFALAGQIENTGLIEVPMGITLREIIYDIGGGIPKGRRFKAAQTGGPSGGCIPARFLDLPVDYESLQQVGTIMGSGGLIVMDESSCMVDVAKFFVDFCREESCGKCIPCRSGTVQIHAILERITTGRGELEDLDRLAELADLLRSTSLCGLGQTAPNPVVSTIRYFRDEYLAHVVERRCPAGVCAMPGRAAAEPAHARESEGA
jgi:bidirectional [NiFe] hydrogenase diaphorase subunit